MFEDSTKQLKKELESTINLAYDAERVLDKSSSCSDDARASEIPSDYKTSILNEERDTQINSLSASAHGELQVLSDMNTAENISRSTKCISLVWKHFILVNHQNVKCRLCGNLFGFNLKTKSTTDMQNHLRSQHHLEFEQSQKQQEVLEQTEKSNTGYLLKDNTVSGDAFNSQSESICEMAATISGIADTSIEDVQNKDQTRSQLEKLATVKESLPWKHFLRTDHHTLECRWCQHRLNFSDSTSNILSHIELKHPEKFEWSYQHGKGEETARPVSFLLAHSADSTDSQKRVQIEETSMKIITKNDAENVCGTEAIEGAHTHQVKLKGKNHSYLRHYRSLIWRHFFKMDNYVKCRWCMFKLKCHSTSPTSNLWKHLRARHPNYHKTIANESNQVESLGKEQAKSKEQLNSCARPGRSLVWKHYFRIGNDRVKCRLCSKELSYCKNTTNLWKHFRVRHHNYEANANEFCHVESLGTEQTQSEEQSYSSGGSGRNRSLVWRHFLKVGKSARCTLCKNEIKHCKNTSNMWQHLKVKHYINFARLQETEKRDEERELPGSESEERKVQCEVNQESQILIGTNIPQTKVVSCEERPALEGRHQKLSITKATQVLDNFTQLGNKNVECEWSNYQFKNNEVSTSKMSKHLAASQPYKIPSKPESDLKGTIEDACSMSSISKSKSYTVRNSASQSLRQSGHGKSLLSQKAIDQCILDYIVMDLQPLSVVENQGFQMLIKKLRPDYDMVSSFRLSKILPDRYKQEKKWLIKEELEKATYVSITTDCWASQANETFITITAHYLNTDWELKSHVLTTRSLDGAADTETAFLNLQDVFKDFRIENKVKTFVTGHSVNIPTISKVIHARHQLCFSQTLNRMIKDSFYETEQISFLTSKVRDIVSLFDSNSTNRIKLREIHESEDKYTSELKLDDESHWNSTYDMLCSYVDQHDGIVKVMSVTEKATLCLDSEEVHAVKEAVETLEPFFEVTSEISSEKPTPASKIMPILKYLLRATSKSSFSLAVKLNKMLQQMIDDTRDLIHLQLATLLDPRFKASGFPSSESSSAAIKTLRQNAEAVKISPHETLLEAGNNSRLGSISSSAQCATQREIKLFLESPLIGKDKDPYQWWKEHADILPRLENIACDVLSIPATSVPSSRLFTRARELISQRRAYLNGESLDMVLFLNNDANVICK